MGASLDFIKNRSVKTIAAAKTVADTWVWDEKTIAAMQDQLDAIAGDTNATPIILGHEAAVSDLEQVMLAGRAAWDGALDRLHRLTMQALGLARTKFRNDAAKTAQLDGLSSRGTSRTVTLAEALALDSAWNSIAPAWAPLPANTLPAFQALRKQCNEQLQADYATKQSALREAAETLSVMAADLEDVNQAWYADATRVFLVGTPEGDMIRGTVPTTYSPSSNPPTPPVVPTP